MSDAIRPENAEDVVQQVASDDAIAAAMPDVPPCPSIAGIIFEQFPEIQEILDIVNTGIGAALAVFDTVSALDPTAQSNQAKSGLSGAKEKAIRAVEKAAKEIKEEAEAVATAAYEAAKAEVTKLEEMIEAIGQGIIDIGTDLENIDEITLNAIEAQFPGFKNALECLNGLAGSGAAMANGDGAKKQINTPPPDNPATEKNPIGVLDPETLNIQLVESEKSVEVLAKQLLRDRESFRPNAYYDENAFRLGYGSDTITRADGSVVAVTSSSTVTLEDAERDLERRVNTEFGPRAQQQVGEQHWQQVSNQVKAVYISLAYNYGSVPQRVRSVIASSGNNQNAIADAIEALGSDNGGINRRRRQIEANLVRNAPRGPVSPVKEYPHVMTDPDDPSIIYEVYPGNSVYVTNKNRSPVALSELNPKFPSIDLTKLPVMTDPSGLNSSDNVEVAGDPQTDIPEESRSTFDELDDLIEQTGLEQGSIIIEVES